MAAGRKGITLKYPSGHHRVFVSAFYPSWDHMERLAGRKINRACPFLTFINGQDRISSTHKQWGKQGGLLTSSLQKGRLGEIDGVQLRSNDNSAIWQKKKRKKNMCKGVATHSLITAIVFTYNFSTYSTFSATVLLWSDLELNTLLKGITVAGS